MKLNDEREMKKKFKYTITDHLGNICLQTNDEEEAVAYLDKRIMKYKGYWYLWERGFDEPIQSGGVAKYDKYFKERLAI